MLTNLEQIQLLGLLLSEKVISQTDGIKIACNIGGIAFSSVLKSLTEKSNPK